MFMHFFNIVVLSLGDFDVNFAPFVLYFFYDSNYHEVIVSFGYGDDNSSEPITFTCLRLLKGLNVNNLLRS
jgi:hypothetical protein